MGKPFKVLGFQFGGERVRAATTEEVQSAPAEVVRQEAAPVSRLQAAQLINELMPDVEALKVFAPQLQAVFARLRHIAQIAEKEQREADEASRRSAEALASADGKIGAADDRIGAAYEAIRQAELELGSARVARVAAGEEKAEALNLKEVADKEGAEAAQATAALNAVQQVLAEMLSPKVAEEVVEAAVEEAAQAADEVAAPAEAPVEGPLAAADLEVQNDTSAPAPVNVFELGGGNAGVEGEVPAADSDEVIVNTRVDEAAEAAVPARVRRSLGQMAVDLVFGKRGNRAPVAEEAAAE